MLLQEFLSAVAKAVYIVHMPGNSDMLLQEQGFWSLLCFSLSATALCSDRKWKRQAVFWGSARVQRTPRRTFWYPQPFQVSRSWFLPYQRDSGGVMMFAFGLLNIYFIYSCCIYEQALQLWWHMKLQLSATCICYWISAVLNYSLLCNKPEREVHVSKGLYFPKSCLV